MSVFVVLSIPLESTHDDFTDLFKDGMNYPLMLAIETSFLLLLLLLLLGVQVRRPKPVKA